MIKQSITAEDMCDIINELIHLDLKCANKLFSTRVSCNRDIAKHEAIQVNLDDNLNPTVGIIGLLNGMFGAKKDGSGIIVLAVDTDNIPIRAFIKED